MTAIQTSAEAPRTSFTPADQSRIAASALFGLEDFQNLSDAELLLAQTVCGHGTKWGIWETSEIISPGGPPEHYRSIDLAKRIRSYLAKEAPSQVVPDSLLQDGVRTLVRLGLLMRLAPASGKRVSKNSRLTPSTLATRMYLYGPKLVARAVRRKSEDNKTSGLISCLSIDDIRELSFNKYTRIELDRLSTLSAKGWWADAPPQPDIGATTDPRGPENATPPSPVATEHQPIPDEYLAEMGPRILWLIRDLGPRLLRMLEDLAEHFASLDWSKVTKGQLIQDYGIVNKFIARHLSEIPWVDGAGKPLTPPFPLTTGMKATNRFEWPPRHYEQLKVLSLTVQSAHLFVTLLACAGRIGEVEGLSPSCVTTARDGKDYLRGWTYKLSGNLFGDARQWPAPVVMVQALGQQARLAAVWSRLPQGRLEQGPPKVPVQRKSLWFSLKTRGGERASQSQPAGDKALMTLASRVGMDPKPGGINLHPHRFRKTIGRLAGVALFNSPLILKRLFGHKSIEMTLHYILSQEGVRTEAEAVLRELRILHCAEALEEIRDAIANGKPLPGHSGTPASRMAEAVKEHEARLSQSGRVWTNGSAYELAYLLTANGQGWRFIQRGVVCTKVPGEDGMCRLKKKRGEPDTSNCKPECDNRIILALRRRDIGEILDSYLDVARLARKDEQYMVFYAAMEQFIEELDAFQDIGERYLADSEVRLLIEEYESLPR